MKTVQKENTQFQAISENALGQKQKQEQPGGLHKGGASEYQSGPTEAIRRPCCQQADAPGASVGQILVHVFWPVGGQTHQIELPKLLQTSHRRLEIVV